MGYNYRSFPENERRVGAGAGKGKRRRGVWGGSGGMERWVGWIGMLWSKRMAKDMGGFGEGGVGMGEVYRAGDWEDNMGRKEGSGKLG